jgi:hypothetical protein
VRSPNTDRDQQRHFEDSPHLVDAGETFSHKEIVIEEGSQAQVDLGLAILEAISPPGKSHTCETIAAYCGCSRGYISAVERRAIAKLRRALRKQGFKSVEKELL